MANCKDCGSAAVGQPEKVGSFRPNPFGLYDMGGSIDQWVEDCWHRNYQGAPADGSAWTGNDCTSHVIRSGSWKNDARYIRPANRDSYDTNVRYPTHGFRWLSPNSSRGVPFNSCALSSGLSIQSAFASIAAKLEWLSVRRSLLTPAPRRAFGNDFGPSASRSVVKRVHRAVEGCPSRDDG